MGKWFAWKRWPAALAALIVFVAAVTGGFESDGTTSYRGINEPASEEFTVVSVGRGRVQRTTPYDQDVHQPPVRSDITAAALVVVRRQREAHSRETPGVWTVEVVSPREGRLIVGDEIDVQAAAEFVPGGESAFEPMEGGVVYLVHLRGANKKNNGPLPLYRLIGLYQGTRDLRLTEHAPSDMGEPVPLD